MNDEKFLKHIGIKINSIRKRRGIKQAELAKRIHKTQDAISAYENGKRALFIKDLSVLAEALQVSPSYLLQNVSDEYFSEEFVEGFLSYIQTYDPQSSQLFNQLEITTPTFDFLLQLFRKGLRQEIRQQERQKKTEEEKAQLELIRTKLSDKLTVLGSDILNALDILGVEHFHKLIKDLVVVYVVTQNTKESND